jgi:hypothetical protein
MSYIGNQPQYTSFLTDTFSGNGSTTVFTLAVAPVNTSAMLVAISGVLQDPTTYGIVGRILTFSQAPPTGTGNISIRYLALPASNITTTAYRSVTEFTATAGQTTFTPASYTPGFINVFRSGVRLGVSNFTATNGVTVVLNNATAAGDLITIESFFISGVLNAIPNVTNAIGPGVLSANAVTSASIAAGAVGQVALDIGNTAQPGTGAMLVPLGTTAQRPATPVDGMVRFNSTLNSLETYRSGVWTSSLNNFPGSTQGNPATSAVEIQTFNPTAANGFYWIRQTGATAFQHYCIFRDFNGAPIQGGPWTVPFSSPGTHNDLSTSGPTAASQFAAKCTAIGISTPGRGMENFRTTSEVYGAWLAVKRAIWEGYNAFVSGRPSAAGGVIAMPMVNINGEGGGSDHRLIYNTAQGTHLPPNIDGDACNANQLYCGWWGVNDVASWTTNNNAIPGPEDWGPAGGGATNTSYGGAGLTPLAFCCVYR